jgi:spore germination cell wall hydrolase CwlJ-like protein
MFLPFFALIDEIRPPGISSRFASGSSGRPRLIGEWVMSFRPEHGMRRVLIACTALSLLGALSALLDYSFARGVLRSSVQDGLRYELPRLLAALLPGRAATAVALESGATLKLGAVAMAETEAESEPPHLLTASLTPLSAHLPEAEETPEINRDLKADRVFAEIAVPKIILPEAEPVGEGASAALFLLSPGLPPSATTPAETLAPSVSLASNAIIAGPVAAAPVALPVRPPGKNLFVTSATAAASSPLPASRYGWSDLMRMAAMKGGDGEEPAKPFGALSEKEFRARELRCMATAVYFEARGESVRGQIAVGQVIMNRVRSDFYPNTICGVVFQGQWNKNACQFSFACDGVTDAPKEKEQWAEALDVAKQVISGKVYLNDIAGATHYHAVYVRPDWRRDVKRIKQIGVHIFYKAPFVNPLASNPDYTTM